MSTTHSPTPRVLATGGALATAVAFGPARIGFGLFLPRFREAFSLSMSTAGVIASAAFAGFFGALLLAGVLVVRRGPRLPVALGSATALVGMLIVAIAQNGATLAAGVVIAATSAGFCWTPFNNAAERGVPDARRERTLSIISTGTTGGIVCAGLLALAVAGLAQGWRTAWVVFAAAALASALVNLSALARLPADTGAAGGLADLKRLRHRAAWPLYAIALSFGVTNSIYLSFCVERVSQAGGLTGIGAALSGPVMYVALGIGGVLGLFTADIKARVGLTALVRGIFVCSFASLLLLGLTPTLWIGVLAAAALQGVCLMVLSAIFSFWSDRLYPDLPTISFTAVLTVFAFGNIVGPVVAGFTAGAIGLGVTLAGTGMISLATALLFPGDARRRALADGAS